MDEPTTLRHMLRVPDGAPRAEIRRAMRVMEWLEHYCGYDATVFTLAWFEDVGEE